MDQIYSLLKKHLPFILLIVFIAISFLISVNKIGISWDENTQRSANGLLNYYYIKYNNLELISNSNEKFHGPAFEIALIYLEKIFGLNEINQIVLMRHLAVMTLFLISIIVFYRINLKIFNNQLSAFFACLMLFASPRIFADVFYNSKDIPFLCFSIFTLAALINFNSNKSIANALLCSFLIAFAVDIRIIGVLLPVIFFAWKFFESALKREKLIPQKRIIGIYPLLFFSTLLFIYLMWPILWINPINNFLDAIKEASKFQWNNFVFYRGETIQASNLPWHYLPVWIFVTNPLASLILFATGMLFTFGRFILSAINKSIGSNYLPVVALFVAAVFAIVFITKPIIYDSWRHFFFIYPFIIIVAIAPVNYAFEIISGSTNKVYKYISISIIGVLFSEIAFTIVSMFQIIPYSNVYFNRLYFNNYNAFAAQFETDYWGLSFKEMYQKTLGKDTSLIVPVSYDNIGYASTYNTLTIDEQRRLLLCQSVNESKYHFTNYRNVKENQTQLNAVNFDSVMAGNFCIARVLKNNKFTFNKSELLFHYTENFENRITENGLITDDKRALSGTKVNMCNYDNMYSANFSLKNKLLNDSNSFYYATISFSKMDLDEYQISYLVVTMDSLNENKYYQAYQIDANALHQKNKWSNESFNVFIPAISDSSKQLKIFFNNVGRTSFMIDDWEVDFYKMK